MSRKSTESVLGTDFSLLMDEKEQDELVRQQLLEIRKTEKPVAAEKSAETKQSAPTDEPPPAEIAVAAQGEAAEEAVAAAPSPDDREKVATVEIDDLAMVEIFLQETNDHLENIEEKIVRLEENHDSDLVDEIFRSMHTIKGTSSFFGFTTVTDVSHETESLLDDLRAGKTSMSSSVADILLAAADHLKSMVHEIIESCSGKSQSDVPFIIAQPVRDTDAFKARIGELRGGQDPRSSGSEAGEGVPPAADPASRARTSDRSGANDLVSQEMIDSFKDETEELLSEAEMQLLQLENEPRNLTPVDHTFRCIHTVKGNAGFLGYETIEQVCMNLEDVLDVVRRGERTVDHSMITTILRTIDSLRHSVVAATTPSEPGSEGSSAGDEAEQYKPLGEMLVSLGLVSEEAVGDALDEQERRLGEILVAKGDLSPEALEEVLKEQEKASAASMRKSESLERKDVRVDVHKLDRLFDLMGELITAEAMVVQNPDIAGLELERFDRAASYLGKITRQMQEITMSVRMIPLEGMFNKVRRVVRDLVRRMGKPVVMHDSGRDTEMDRNVIESLSDPLVHIIRNAVDHGIESAEEREKAGKPAEGQIHLGARYEGSEIWISCKDDGRGLNREKILARAIAAGLVSEAQAPEIPDSQVWKFIFEPGFSTAEEVSDVSGRGVGMDVVKRNIEQLRGKVDVTSTAGKGTEVILKIPLTLAIIDGVTTRVGRVLYSIPLSEIREFHQATDDQLTATGSGGEVLSLRDEIIPVIRLRRFFRAEAGAEGNAGIFIVVQSGSERVALFVDEIVGYHQIVVKSLPGYMGNMRGLSGCSVLGNGDVSLIIDTNSLIKERAA